MGNRCCQYWIGKSVRIPRSVMADGFEFSGMKLLLEPVLFCPHCGTKLSSMEKRRQQMAQAIQKGEVRIFLNMSQKEAEWLKKYLTCTGDKLRRTVEHREILQALSNPILHREENNGGS